jgi:electron transfer flavoprotein alpha subunit
VVVREGALPAGAVETVEEAAGRVLLAGSGTEAAADALGSSASEVIVWEAGPFRPGAFSAALAPELTSDRVVVLPASADGRDLAPRLARRLGRRLFAPAIEVLEDRVVLVRSGGLAVSEIGFDEPMVATLQPGSRGTGGVTYPPAPRQTFTLPLPTVLDAVSTALIEADAATVDLAEAKRIMAGGAGLGSPDVMGLLGRVATALGCATGATRVLADAGWVPFSRQIGTTGAVVDPDLYLAFGISGAVQHVSGLGSPRDVVAVNTDPSCPMMQLADLAIVADAPALLRELAARLGLNADDGLPLAPETVPETVRGAAAAAGKGPS